ncbi:MAG: thiamine phosphate synthase [Alphaproteobacteria bacterium]|nr:thiamine phosphate synthase [Alphaproteobacteria bacterium]
MKATLDITLYLIVGPSHDTGDRLALVRAAVAGGVTLVQLRDKTSSTRQMIADARALKQALAGTGVPLLINDRVDVALAAGADGVHVGRDDISAQDARRILGPNYILGITVKTLDEVRAVDPGIVDYASIGGVFETSSKHNPDAPIGLLGLQECVAALTAGAPGLTRCAIAGIDEGRTESVMAAGVDGICVVSAITKSPDPQEAAMRLRALVDRAKRVHERAFV